MVVFRAESAGKKYGCPDVRINCEGIPSFSSGRKTKQSKQAVPNHSDQLGNLVWAEKARLWNPAYLLPGHGDLFQRRSPCLGLPSTLVWRLCAHPCLNPRDCSVSNSFFLTLFLSVFRSSWHALVWSDVPCITSGSPLLCMKCQPRLRLWKI